MDESKFHNICRICLKTSPSLSSIFTSNSEIYIQLTNLASVQVLPEDSLPQEICNDCISDLKFSFNFKMKIEQSDLKLRKNLQNEAVEKENSEDYTNYEVNLISEIGQDYEYKTNLKEEVDIDICETVIDDNNVIFKTGLQINTAIHNTSQEAPLNKKFTECHLCNKTFSCRNHLTRHIKSHKPIKNYSCNICGSSFMQSVTLRKHSLSKHVETEKLHNYDETHEETSCSGVKNYSCNICGASFMQSASLRKHSLSKHMETEKRHKCETCKKTFETRSSLIKHIRTHAGENPYFCGTCQKNFISIEDLNNHKKMHFERECPFVCEVCSRGFSAKQSLKVHQLRHEGEKNFICAYCSKAFLTKTVLKNHILLLHLNTYKFICKICAKAFKSKEAHNNHNRKHAGKKYVPSHQCCMCEKKCCTATLLEYHIKSVHTKERNYSCDYCFKSYFEPQHLKVHLRSHTGERPYPCRFCEKSFYISHIRKRHEMIHTGEKPHVCHLCGSSFTQKNTLKTHLLRHEGEKNFICSYCSKGYLTKGNLKKHILFVHLNISNFVCEICAKTYKSKMGLDNHIRKHTGEKHVPTEQCPKCEKKCSSKALLKDHIKSVHTKERDFSCEYCSKSFVKAHYLKVHLRSHTGERPYPCRFCEKSFYTSHIRKRHEMIHTGERPHVCNLCGTSFTQKSTLKTHMKSHR